MTRYFTIIAAVFTVCLSWSQQVPQSYLYSYNAFMINPAASGLNRCTEVGVSHHNQWVKIEGAPITNYLTISTQVGRKWGLGGQFMMDKIGMLQQFSGLGNVSYGLLNGKQTLRLGLSIGYNNYRVNPSSAIAFDPLDPIVNGGNQSAGSVSSDVGILYKNGALDLFASVKQILRTYSNFGYSNLQGYGQRPHFIVGSGYQIDLSNNWSLRPNVLLKSINNVMQADLNVDANYKKFVHFGGGFRTQVGAVIRAGIVLKEKFFFGYAYEAPIANIASYSSGSHEMILKMTLCKPEKSPKISQIKIDTVFKEIRRIDTVLITKKEIQIDTVYIERNITQIDSLLVSQGSLDKVILFEFDKSLVKKESFGELESLINLLNMNSNYKVSLEGHTDATGSEAYNVGLSMSRVYAIRDFLYANGIGANRIVIKHFGESKPKTTNASAAGRQSNRRVDISILKE